MDKPTIFIVGIIFALLFILLPVIVVSAVWYKENIPCECIPEFEGEPNVGSQGEDGMPYGWYCYPKTEYNTRLNDRCYHWAVNDRGICEWR